MNNPNKILFITHYGGLYGANRSLLTLIEYFNGLDNFEVSVLLPAKGGMVDKLKIKTIDYKIIPYNASFLYVRPKWKYLMYPISLCFNLILFPYMIFHVKKINPKLIYSNTSAENFGVILAKCLNIKHIQHLREFMSLHYNSYFIFGKRAKLAYLSMSDCLIFVSHAVRKYIEGSRKIKSKFKIIYNGIKISTSNIEPVDLPKMLNLGIVGLLDPGKGQDIAIRYFNSIQSNYSEAKLHVIGDSQNNYKKSLINLVDELNLNDSVYFHGFKDNADAIYANIDVLVVFSKYEGFGRVTIEAMMRGIPVIGLDNSGTSEIITHDLTGYLFKDQISFEKSIETLMSSKNKFNSIRSQAFKKAKDDFSESNYINNVKSVVEEILMFG